MTQWRFANSPRSLDMETRDVVTMAASRHEKKKPTRMLLSRQPWEETPRIRGGGGAVLPRDDEDPPRLREPVASDARLFLRRRSERARGVVVEGVTVGGLPAVASAGPARRGAGAGAHLGFLVSGMLIVVYAQ